MTKIPFDTVTRPERVDSGETPQPEAKKKYHKPTLTEVQLQAEEAVLGACRTVSTACDTYHY